MKTISALVISSALLSVHAWIAAPAGRVATVAARRLSPVMHAETGQDAGNLSRRSVATRGLFGLAAGLAPWASRADAADIAEPFEVAFTVQLNADEAGEVVFKVMGLHRKAERYICGSVPVPLIPFSKLEVMRFLNVETHAGAPRVGASRRRAFQRACFGELLCRLPFFSGPTRY